MPAVWPASLPQDMLYPNFQEEMPARVVRTRMDAGPAKARPRFTAAPTPLHGSVRLDITQRATFRTFYDSTLAGGALSFDWKHPVTGVACTMRFTGDPRIRARAANIFEADLDLEILP